MNLVVSTIASFVSNSVFAAICGPRLRELRQRSLFFSALVVAAALVPQRASAQINVNTTTQGDTHLLAGGPYCSIQEAIYAAEFGGAKAISQIYNGQDVTYQSGCTDDSGAWDTIVLQNTTYEFSALWDGDAHNPFGPTATPIIFKTMTIVGHGATLRPAAGSGNFRLFAIGYANLNNLDDGTAYSGTGNLSLQDVYVTGFQVKGGDGGYGIYDSTLGGSGGGLGAGGAIYVGEIPGAPGVPALTVQNSTFVGNGATGGNGTEGAYSAGGGGMGGNGGLFGGGGGSRGNGGRPCGNGGDCFDSAGGGGTVYAGADYGPGGYLCGGSGGSSSHHDGHDATCAGGGGGGYYFNGDGNGGNGAFGGGGGGGSDQGGSGNGGNGGFGGGGGEGGNVGGHGGFGGGGGGIGGLGGAFGGNADPNNENGGGGGALGGAIFNDSGTVVVQNSTFFNNSVTRGISGGGNADNGGDSGGAIFSRNGSLKVQNVTISGNQATGAGGGIVVYEDGPTAIFVLDNTIIANNGAQECITEGDAILFSSGGVKSANNLIVNNSGCPNVTVKSDPMLDTQPKPNTPAGDTPTIALLPGSPAIDAGDDTTALGTDQRGVLRPQGASSDIGAFERLPQADLSLAKAVSNSKFKAGDSVTYTLTLTNLGPDTANSITVTDNSPAALTYVSCSAPGGSCGPQGAAVVITYSSLAANSSATITITGTLNSGYSRGTIITNTASVQDTSPADPDNTNNSASISFTVIVPDFSISADTPVTVTVGSSATSSVKITSIDTFSSSVAMTSSGPLGFDDSFNPTAVTPPSDGSTSSTLTISLEPSVAPGTYSVTATGTSGALTHSTSITANVQATIDGTITVINTDQALGCIDNSGISGALQSKLNAAKADIAAGKIQEGINTLKALLNQLQAQAGKHISTSCKDGSGNTFDADAVLVTDVKAILASLGVNVAADPIMGSVVNANGIGIPGITVNLLSPSKSIVTSATSDAMGFFYFPGTGGLTAGATYTNKVAIVKPYKNSTPSSQSYTWRASTVLLKNFVIN